MTRVIPMTLKKREDKVTDGEIAEQVLANAPQREERFLRRAEGGGVSWVPAWPLPLPSKVRCRTRCASSSAS